MITPSALTGIPGPMVTPEIIQTIQIVPMAALLAMA